MSIYLQWPNNMFHSFKVLFHFSTITLDRDLILGHILIPVMIIQQTHSSPELFYSFFFGHEMPQNASLFICFHLSVCFEYFRSLPQVKQAHMKCRVPQSYIIYVIELGVANNTLRNCYEKRKQSLYISVGFKGWLYNQTVGVNVLSRS